MLQGGIVGEDAQAVGVHGGSLAAAGVTCQIVLAECGYNLPFLGPGTYHAGCTVHMISFCLCDRVSCFPSFVQLVYFMHLPRPPFAFYCLRFKGLFRQVSSFPLSPISNLVGVGQPMALCWILIEPSLPFGDTEHQVSMCRLQSKFCSQLPLFHLVQNWTRRRTKRLGIRGTLLLFFLGNTSAKESQDALLPVTLQLFRQHLLEGNSQMVTNEPLIKLVFALCKNCPLLFPLAFLFCVVCLLATCVLYVAERKQHAGGGPN